VVLIRRSAWIGVVAAMTGLLAGLDPAAARAQARTVVTSTVAVDAIYDENVLWRPTAQSDHVWHLTPGLNVDRTTVRSRWLLDTSMDAAWYARYRDLSTAAARQHVGTRWEWRPSQAGTVAFAGGYENSVNPSDINVGTGLALGRLRAWRWFGGPEYEHALDPTTSLVTSYRVTGEFASTTPGIFTHAAQGGIRRRISARDELEATYTAELFQFRDSHRQWSHQGLLRWRHRLTSSVLATVAGGARLAGGRASPDVEVRLERHGGWLDASASYSWNQVTALGVDQLVDVHRASGTLTYARPNGLRASIGAGVYRSLLDRDRAQVYRGTITIEHPIAGPVAVTAAYAIDYQRGRVGQARGTPLTPLLVSADANAPRIVVEPAGAPLRRSTFVVSLVWSGTMRSAAGPGPEGPADDPFGTTRDRFGEAVRQR
jgi:hypothetical protein